MGALLGLGLMLSFAVATLELTFVMALRPSKYKAEKHQSWTRPMWKLLYNMGPWVQEELFHSLAFSMSLSIGIGILFPAAGISVMFAGVFSTLLTQPVYWLVRMYHQAQEKLRRNHAE